MTTDATGSGQPGTAATTASDPAGPTPTEVDAAAPIGPAEAPAAAAPVAVTSASPARPGLIGRARAEGVTGPAVVALSALLVAGGVSLDLRRDATVGLGTGVAFVLAALAGPAVVRFRSLVTAAALPPLLFVAAAAALARLSGANRGSREIGLDIGTTLALSAPLLFAGTMLGLVVVLVRIGRRLAARH